MSIVSGGAMYYVLFRLFLFRISRSKWPENNLFGTAFNHFLLFLFPSLTSIYFSPFSFKAVNSFPSNGVSNMELPYVWIWKLPVQIWKQPHFRGKKWHKQNREFFRVIYIYIYIYTESVIFSVHIYLGLPGRAIVVSQDLERTHKTQEDSTDRFTTYTLWTTQTVWSAQMYRIDMPQYRYVLVKAYYVEYQGISG
jgi:hypothetical protein